MHLKHVRVPVFFVQFQPQQSSAQLPVQVFDFKTQEGSLSDTESLSADQHKTSMMMSHPCIKERVPQGPSSYTPDSDASPSSLSQQMPGASPPLKRQKAMLFVSALFNLPYKASNVFVLQCISLMSSCRNFVSASKFIYLKLTHCLNFNIFIANKLWFYLVQIG